MKIRLINSFEDPRVFCELLDKTAVDKEDTPKVTLANTLPTFDVTPLKGKSLNEAFGEPVTESQEDAPF
jgi:hypothetical protein